MKYQYRRLSFLADLAHLAVAASLAVGFAGDGSGCPRRWGDKK